MTLPGTKTPAPENGTTEPTPGSPPPEAPTSKGRAAVRKPADSSTVAIGWWLAAIGSIAVAATLSVVVASRTDLDTAHRAAAAGTALLVVAALAVLAQVILLSYQVRMRGATGAAPGHPTLAFRRRGLKAAIIGQDGRASTSKTQVVLWTVAVVWALIDLLLLARAYPGANLFASAVTKNWRPEYLVLLGLPVAAATTAKAVVAGANSGRGPVARKAVRKGDSVYMRDPVAPGVWGFAAGTAELIAGEDGTVAWADLQYVIFTLITLAYFAVQFLAQPTEGLPTVPATLLTLTGISSTTYVANKIVNTKASAT